MLGSHDWEYLHTALDTLPVVALNTVYYLRLHHFFEINSFYVSF